jgi:hypothetical protein
MTIEEKFDITNRILFEFALYLKGNNMISLIEEAARRKMTEEAGGMPTLSKDLVKFSELNVKYFKQTYDF